MFAHDSRAFRLGRRSNFGRVATVRYRAQLRGPLIIIRWFLSLYINSMPLIFAFRVVDCVLAMGAKVLFQIGLGAYTTPRR
jgi:hypothetical protein